jgi:hypothetical protein
MVSLLVHLTGVSGNVGVSQKVLSALVRARYCCYNISAKEGVLA